MPRPVTLELLSTGLDASCYSSAATREAVYAQISHDIHMMEEAIYTLKKRHNSLCIIQRLPRELLATIFKWIASMERDSRSCKWLRVGEVCTEWRRVALDCPALWCFYRSTNLNWLDIVLRRSGTLPLYVDQQPYRKRSKGFRQALGEAKRIRELTFTAYYTKHWERMCKALVKLEPEVLPLLESFKARLKTYGRVLALPDNLFKSPLPRLKALSLYGCLIGDNASLLPNLTSLALGQVEASNEDSLPISLAQLMGILKQAPNLEYLELKGACKKVDEADNIISRPQDEVVQLPRLQRIKFAGPMCNAILSQITHPSPLAHIALRFSLSRGTERNSFALCATLANRIRPIHHLQVVSAHKGRYNCTSLGQDSPSLDPPPSVAPDLDFVIENYYTDNPEGSLMRILETLSMAALEVLDVVRYVTFSKALWLAGFGELDNLTTIRVAHTTVLTLLQALKKTYSLKEDASGKPPSRRRVRPSFKSLRVLVIQGWTFDSYSIEKLAKCLAARRRRGAKLQQLSVVEGTFSGLNPTEAVVKLRKNVKEVIWDVQIATKQSQIDSKRDEDAQSISSNEVESWDYSSPEENFPYVLSPDEDDDWFPLPG